MDPVAVAGLALALLSLAWQAWTWWHRERVDLRLQLWKDWEPAVLHRLKGIEPSAADRGLVRLRIINRARSVHIEAIGWWYGGGKNPTYTPGMVDSPLAIPPNEAELIDLPSDVLRAMHDYRSATCYVRLVTGDTYMSTISEPFSRMPFDPAQFRLRRVRRLPPEEKNRAHRALSRLIRRSSDAIRRWRDERTWGVSARGRERGRRP